MSGDEETAGNHGGTARLRPRARLMRTLGDELISSETVALIELVKNSFDADASRVLIRFHEPLEEGAGGIDVIDDGHGMTLETVHDVFLEPATLHRRRETRSEELGRVVTGEKGIGRFAVSRLADQLELVSRRPGAPDETRVLFDWRLFDEPDAYLDDIEVAWETSEPADVAPGGVVEALWADRPEPPPQRMERGTVLRMQQLRARWGREQLEELRTGLSRLVSPFLFEQQRGGDDTFSIKLEAPPAMADLSGLIEPPEALREPRYLLTGDVDGNGGYAVEMRVRDPEHKVTHTGRIDLGDRTLASGPFRIELRVWDRDASSMAALGVHIGTSAAQVRRDLDAVAGINVYRDGFRVMPYGERGNDWLNLDGRRVNNPTMRLSNNQVLGYVLISKDGNPRLRDQTNREGLMRNQAYSDLQTAVLQILARLEEARYATRPRQPRRPSGERGLFSGFDMAAVRAYAAERYSSDSKLTSLLGETQKTIDEDVRRAQEVVVRYRRLATLGGLIDKVLHDGRAPLAKIGNEAVIGLRSLSRRERDCEDLLAEMHERLTRVGRQGDVLATVFRRIEPFGGRRRGRPAELALEDVIADGFGVLEGDIRREGVDVSLPSTRTKVTVDASELQEVVVNLLENSLHWLTSVPRDRRAVRVDVNRDADGVHILFSDSGPGVREDVQELIFDPYFSTRENGVGLGLNIAGEIVDEYYGGELRLLEQGPLPGANFLVTLKRRI